MYTHIRVLNSDPFIPAGRPYLYKGKYQPSLQSYLCNLSTRAFKFVAHVPPHVVHLTTTKFLTACITEGCMPDWSDIITGCMNRLAIGFLRIRLLLILYSVTCRKEFNNFYNSNVLIWYGYVHRRNCTYVNQNVIPGCVRSSILHYSHIY